MNSTRQRIDPSYMRPVDWCLLAALVMVFNAVDT